MSSPAINTVIKMMESLSEDKQDEIVKHLREYIQDLQDEQGSLTGKPHPENPIYPVKEPVFRFIKQFLSEDEINSNDLILAKAVSLFDYFTSRWRRIPADTGFHFTIDEHSPDPRQVSGRQRIKRCFSHRSYRRIDKQEIRFVPFCDDTAI